MSVTPARAAFFPGTRLLGTWHAARDIVLQRQGRVPQKGDADSRSSPGVARLAR
ncbi:MAG TPA: hypothetical protein VGE50_02255 [Gammaproteobacteria bacterium]